MERRRTLGSEGESTMNEEYELVGTASITEDTAIVEIQLSKPCTDVYLFCENLIGTNPSQLYIKIADEAFFSGINQEISKTAQNTIQHIRKIANGVWIRTGNNHAYYTLTTAATQMYKNMIDGVSEKYISRIKLYASSGINLTSGTIKVYGK